jgi:tetratricopeptide (TPR) repeat protein
MLKPKININKTLAKIIQIPTMENNAALSLSIFDAMNRAEEAFLRNYCDDAIVILERIIAAAPKFVAPYLPLSMILRRSGNKGVARELMVKALVLEPNNIKVLCEASSFFSLLYENDYSYELIHKALKIDPRNPVVINQYAGAVLKRGDEELAIKLFKQVIAMAPDFAGAYQNLASADIDTIDEPMLEQILAIVHRQPIGGPNRVPLLFAAAKKLAKLGRIDEEFACLDEANKIVRGASTWTWQHELNDWLQIQKVFTADFVTKIQQTASTDIKPMVLATLPRSGATLIEMILSSHSKVCAGGESHLFHGPVNEQSRLLLGDVRYFQRINEANAAPYLQSIPKRTKELMAEQKLNKDYVTDKTPHNYYTLGVILTAFPEAKVIHIQRHPLDICLSCYQLNFNDGAEYTNNLADTARIYNIFNAAMAHWKALFPNRILTVNYKDLVEDPEQIARNMLAFYDLEWEDQCLKFYESDQIVNTASFKQVRNPINKSGLDRWKKYEKYLEPAITALNKGLSE